MGRRVDIDELIDVHEVATILGLEHRNTVSTYLKRYADMPRPIVEFRTSRIRLWLRPEVEAWVNKRTAGEN